MHFTYLYFCLLFHLSLLENCIDGLRSASPNKPSVKLNLRSSSAIAEANDATSTPSSQPPTTKTPTCCNCFGPKLKTQWDDDDTISNQMSEVYCRTCDEEEHEVVRIPKNRFDSPAILTNVTKRKVQQHKIQTNVIKPNAHSIFNIESELEMPNINAIIDADRRSDKKLIENNENNSEDCELGDDVVISSDNIFDNSESSVSKIVRNTIDTNDACRMVRGKEELPVASEVQTESTQQLCQNYNRISSDNMSNDIESKRLNKSDVVHKPIEVNVKISCKQLPDKVICTHDHPLIDSKVNANESTETSETNQIQSKRVNDNSRNNNSNQSMTMSTHILERHSILKRMQRMYSTLPKMKKTIATNTDTANCGPYSIPSRTTPDGTTIYYMCDLPKNVIKGSQSNH